MPPTCERGHDWEEFYSGSYTKEREEGRHEHVDNCRCRGETCNCNERYMKTWTVKFRVTVECYNRRCNLCGARDKYERYGEWEEFS